jgi:hypothetical protein
MFERDETIKLERSTQGVEMELALHGIPNFYSRDPNLSNIRRYGYHPIKGITES